MPGRKDALCAAAEAVLAVEATARSSGSTDTVATTGVCRVHPGAINSIPDRVTLEIDVRDIDPGRRDPCPSGNSASAIEAIGRRRGRSKAGIECLNSDPPASTAGIVVEAIEAACGELGLKSLPIDQPRLSRFALHGPDRAHRNDLHPLQGWNQPPAGRIIASPRRSPGASKCWRWHWPAVADGRSHVHNDASSRPLKCSGDRCRGVRRWRRRPRWRSPGQMASDRRGCDACWAW